MANIDNSCFPHLVIGGIRSGKSQFGEDAILQTGKQPHYIATGEKTDENMSARIKKHINRRGNNWQLWEEGINIADVIERLNNNKNAVLIDCISTWIGNLYHHKCDIKAAQEHFLRTLGKTQASIVIISSDVGAGGIAGTQLSRDYCDNMGEFNQEMAKICASVSYIVAGLPLSIKSPIGKQK